MNNISQNFCRLIAQGKISFPNNQYWNNGGAVVTTTFVCVELSCELGFSILCSDSIFIKLNDENNAEILMDPGGLRYIANSTSRIYVRSAQDRVDVDVKIWSNIDLTEQLTCDRLEELIKIVEAIEIPTTIEVSNFPASIQVSNFPASIQVSNFPAIPTSIQVSNFPASIQVSNFPAIPTSIQVSNFPAFALDNTLLSSNTLLTNIYNAILGLGVGMRYVNRGDPVNFDKTFADFTLNWNWQDLDLSALIPIEAASHLVHLRVQLVASDSTSYIRFRTKGNVNIINIAELNSPVAGEEIESDFEIECDINRKIQYYGSVPNITALNLTVLGWWRS